MNPVVNNPQLTNPLCGAICDPGSPSRRAIMKNDLAARAKAYAAYSAAYAADPAQAMFVEQVRRDAEAAHRWLEQQKGQTS